MSDNDNIRDADGLDCRTVIDQGSLAMLDFWAEGCGPCRSLKPVLADLASNRPELTILKVDIIANDELAARYNVRSVPSLLLFKGGECVDRLVGKSSYVQIDRMVAGFV